MYFQIVSYKNVVVSYFLPTCEEELKIEASLL